ncbi:FHIPEP family type III secretion protein [Burkholderia sp. MSMB1826]|uniref:FHIPEP family type III secretion protein n=1 Tax=Burkholderia sp. MSMB1826 TaxID=1637875 RepID=UPI00075EDD3B|nr:FHIPEP family type III secretion protein [Burkholderia sp. MSMB1826]KVL13712.1 hypersensitivity response secretion protein hrcV [Burkholderia sp. MSMB1826]
MFKNVRLNEIGGEVGIASLIVAVISLMILPLPPFLIDALLGLNITISVLLLMVTMYIPNATSLYSFPSLLLFTTLFRLSLNIASTKSILLHAEAGHIIESFGELVVGGNLVVGLVVFLIIATVQFIVIAKGSERVAEVGARFTLDAMPGKQMSIDADVRAGNITAEDAQRRRGMLAIESQLHGGMDGAMKFVKGDAIAGLVITLVNILAGIVIGVSYHGMTAGEAANRFSVLSIGDAMVSQIPSLLISVAAGILITRVADEHSKPSSLGTEILRQLSTSSRALYGASALLGGFALVPGFPSALFVMLAVALFTGGHVLRKQLLHKMPNSGPELASLRTDGYKGHAPTVTAHPPAFAAPLAVRLAPQCAAQLDMAALNRAFDVVRRSLVNELGLPFPRTAVWTAVEVPGTSYQILLHDVPQPSIELPTAKAGWEEALANSVGEAVRQHAHLFLGLQETQWILERIGTEYPGLVAEVQKVVPVLRIAEVLKRLLEEQVSIRNLRAIFESLVNWGAKEKDLLLLTEYVRGDLGRYIAHRATEGTGRLSAIVLDVEVEQIIRQSIKQTPAGNFLTLEPQQVEQLLKTIEELAGSRPTERLAIVTSMDIRRYFKRMIEQRLKWLQVYSFQELGDQVDLQPVGRVAF